MIAPTAFTRALGSAPIGDPAGTRAITAIIALLAVIGIGLVMLAVWLFRLTRPDPELLAPLEVMSERKWRRADPVWQRRRLDEVRPAAAIPLQPSVAPPDLDEAFDAGPTASGFDDLHVSREQPAVVVGAVVGDDAAADHEAAFDLPPTTDPDVDTPPELERPALNDWPNPDLDPALVAAAMADLDAELARPVQLGLALDADNVERAASD